MTPNSQFPSLCAHSLLCPSPPFSCCGSSVQLYFLPLCLHFSVDRCVPFFLTPHILLIISHLIHMSHPYSSLLYHCCAIAPCLVSCLTVQPLLPFLSLTLPALLLLCLMSLWGPIFLAIVLVSIVPCCIPLSIFLSSLSLPAVDDQ